MCLSDSPIPPCNCGGVWRAGLPNKEDVKQGLIAYKIAAHAADVANAMKITHEIREKAQAGMEEMSEKFRESGGTVYVAVEEPGS